ncbi:MAG: BamA/TamA family outer membrane protein [Ignavibacteria bacterium]|nr:BamA/TamA family outer membrane protein [Ignavibacteria bacterium]
MQSLIRFFLNGFVLACTLCVGIISAAETPPDTLQTGFDWEIIPIVAYFPETRFMGVLTAFLKYRTESDATFRASSMAVALQATQNAQFSAGVYPEIYLDSNRMRIEGLAEWYLYPYKFFGIGNENPSSNAELYTPNGFRVQVRALHALNGAKVQNGLSVGLRLDVRYDDIRKVEPREDGSIGPLGNGQILGSSGGWYNGIGPMFSYDTRDNNFDARKGLFCEATLVAYGETLGSTYTATLTSAALRAYTQIVDGVSFAARLLLQNVAGTPTFIMWPSIGGNNNLRGVIDAQQRDRISFLTSAELRFPIIWKFRGATFVDAGQVAPSLDFLSPRSLWIGWGGGLRFVFDEKERISLRLDAGVARGDVQFYLSFNEAF